MLTNLLLLFVALAAEQPPAKPPAPLKTAADRPADIEHIRLDLRVNIPSKHVDAKAEIRLVPLREAPSIRFDAVDFDVTSVAVQEEGEVSAEAHAIDFRNDGKTIEIIPDAPLPPGRHVTVRIAYALDNPKSGLHFFSPGSDSDDVAALWSQGESTDNRHWFPCFDHPGEMQTTEIVVDVAKGMEAVSNGRLVSKTDNPDGTVRFHWLQDQPHAAYLVTLVVGDLHVETDTWRGKPVMYYVPQKKKADVERTFGNTTRMLEHFSSVTGVEYPWDKYAQVCAREFGGGMENTSATTLGSGILHDERAHLDYSADDLLAHELAHQWFGDLVTCRDWAHIWLNEGFATYFEAVWNDFDLGRDMYDYSIMNDMASAVRAGKDAPIVDRRYVDPDEMFDSRAYAKGSAILHMLRTRVGDETFWRCIGVYLRTFAHQPVDTNDFRRVLEKETGRSLERFFFDWTERPGAPELDVSVDWLEDEKLAQIDVVQKQAAEAFQFPFEVEFRFDGAESKPFRAEVSEKEHRFLVPLPKRPTMVRVDPRQCVLTDMKLHMGRDLWVRQLTEDPGVALRIGAAKHFGESATDGDIKLLGETLRTEKFWGAGDAIADALAKAGGDKARDALLLGLDAPHPKVRRAVVEALDGFHRDEKVIAALRPIVEAGDASYRVEAAAIRALGKVQPDGAHDLFVSLLSRDSHQEQIRGAALEGLGALGDPAALDVLLDWMKAGKPRPCRIGAIEGAGTLAEQVHLPDADVKRLVDRLTESARDENRRVRGRAVRALRDLGESSSPSLPVLEGLAANDPEEGVRKSAKDAVEKIKAAAPAQVQAGELRDALRELRAENKAMKERLDKLEAEREDRPIEEDKKEAE